MELRIGAIAMRDTAKHQDRLADPSLLTTDSAAVVADPEVDIVIELIGGTDPALTLVRTALENGKPVITGNKELLATHGPELYAVAAEHGVDMLFEAAVMGIPGSPVVLVGEDISRVMGIINGTTSYILTKMSQEGADYADALAGAQALGYARPTRPPTSRATTPAPRLRSSRDRHSASTFDRRCAARGHLIDHAADIDAKRLDYVIKALAVIGAPTTRSPSECIRRWFPPAIRSRTSTTRSTLSSSKAPRSAISCSTRRCGWRSNCLRRPRRSRRRRRQRGQRCCGPAVDHRKRAAFGRRTLVAVLPDHGGLR